MATTPLLNVFLRANCLDLRFALQYFLPVETMIPLFVDTSAWRRRPFLLRSFHLLVYLVACTRASDGYFRSFIIPSSSLASPPNLNRLVIVKGPSSSDRLDGYCRNLAGGCCTVCVPDRPFALLSG